MTIDVELILEPGERDRVVGLDLDRAVVANGEAAGEGAGVDRARQVRGETGEVVAPGSAGGQGLLEEGDGLGVGLGRRAHQRPGEGERGELADLLVRLAAGLARLLGRDLGVDRVSALGSAATRSPGRRRRP